MAAGHPPPRGTLSPCRYQEAQEAQKALGTAVAEALAEARRVLATVQQLDTDAAPRLAWLAAPGSQVSWAVLGGGETSGAPHIGDLSSL